MFKWVVDELKEKKHDCPKILIYCRTIKIMSDVYGMFQSKLGCEDCVRFFVCHVPP